MEKNENNETIKVDITQISKESLEKNLVDLPFSKDFIRLAHKICIIKNNEIIKPSKEIEVQEHQIFFLIENLKNDLQSNIKIDEKEFNDEVKLNDHSTLSNYILKKFNEDGKVTKIFKVKYY
jgi:hypothetical protein